MKVENRLFENLEKGRTSIGAVVTMSDLIVSELAGDCGMDFVWIDAEHAPHTIQDVQRHLIALRGTGCAGLVRVRADEPMLIKPYLDLAPDGIIVPMVNTPELAEAAVAACRYPKTGIRGCGVRETPRVSGPVRNVSSDRVEKHDSSSLMSIKIVWLNHCWVWPAGEAPAVIKRRCKVTTARGRAEEKTMKIA